ncbi:MAG: hypothetical protein KatS3mg022_2429 [Armatimonadota bacterium]|nr:MAG: hypothetical protein KatS3mg022_2429 [Armatimonadota bacterium]
MAPRQTWDEIRAAGLRIVTMVGHASLTDGLNRKENHNRIEDELKRNIDLAAQYDIPVLICFSGNRRGISDEEGIQNCVEGLKRIAPYAEQKGVTLAMELLNSKVDHPRLPVRPHLVGCRSMQTRQLAAREAAVRHLPHADYGGRPHSYYPC